MPWWGWYLIGVVTSPAWFLLLDAMAQIVDPWEDETDERYRTGTGRVPHTDSEVES